MPYFCLREARRAPREIFWILTGADTRLEDTLDGLFVLTGCVCSRAVHYLMAKEQHDAAAAIVCHRQ